MTAKRIVFLQNLLSFIGLEERIRLAWISSAEAQKFVRVVTEFTEKVRAMGPSPIKEYGAFRPAPRFVKGEAACFVPV
jgi:F420-non-reducing hydrogenase iron-sulfur subunit